MVQPPITPIDAGPTTGEKPAHRKQPTSPPLPSITQDARSIQEILLVLKVKRFQSTHLKCYYFFSTGHVFNRPVANCRQLQRAHSMLIAKLIVLIAKAII